MWGEFGLVLSEGSWRQERASNRINEWTPIAFWPLGRLVEEEEVN